MRTLLLVLSLLLAGGGVWWVWGSPSESDPTLEPVGPSRGAGGAPVPELPSLEIPRVGVRGPGDKRMVADPQAEPWESYVLILPGASDGGVSGAALLDAIAGRLYVRTRTQADLDAFRGQVFQGLNPGVGVPLGAAMAAIERAGWRVAVSDPRFVFRPAQPDEAARDREAGAGGR